MVKMIIPPSPYCSFKNPRDHDLDPLRTCGSRQRNHLLAKNKVSRARPRFTGLWPTRVRCSLVTRRHFHPVREEQSVSPEACRDHMRKGKKSQMRNKPATTERKRIRYRYQNIHARSPIKYTDSRNLKISKQCKHIITHNPKHRDSNPSLYYSSAKYLIT